MKLGLGIRTISNLLARSLISILLLLGTAMAGGTPHQPVEVLLIHTNDLHSHLKPENAPLGLGGIARISTKVKELRKAYPNSLFVDGGDWSEGQIYYNLGTGTETLRMMDQLGYDIAVIGNHDWINGPDILLDSYRDSQSKMKLIGANVDVSRYRRGEEFKRQILPYVIQEVGGVKIGFIGLVTYEVIYNRFATPMRMLPTYEMTREIAKSIRPLCDAIVVISHNDLETNAKILKSAPDVDLIVGAHDHIKLTTPMIVPRKNAPDGWVVETGAWGRFLGTVKMRITPRPKATADGRHSVQLLDYKLHQMDASVPEDPEIQKRILQLDQLLEAQYGPIFEDHIGHTDADLVEDHPENLIGNIVTDAYREETQADLAFDQVNMIYGQIHRGTIHTADVMNAMPAVYNPDRKKSWTLHTFPFEGKRLEWILNILFGSTRITGLYGASSIVSVSGLQFDFNPFAKSSELLNPLSPLPFPSLQTLDRTAMSGIGVVDRLMINGRPVEPSRIYRAVAPTGIIYAIDYLNSLIPDLVPLNQAQDTGKESWQVVRSYLSNRSPVQLSTIPLGRMRSKSFDLKLYPGDIVATPIEMTSTGLKVNVTARVRNLGLANSPSSGIVLHLAGNRNGIDQTVEPLDELFMPISLPRIAPGSSIQVSAQGILRGSRHLYPLSAWTNADPKFDQRVTVMVQH